MRPFAMSGLFVRGSSFPTNSVLYVGGVCPAAPSLLGSSEKMGGERICGLVAGATPFSPLRSFTSQFFAGCCIQPQGARLRVFDRIFYALSASCRCGPFTSPHPPPFHFAPERVFTLYFVLCCWLECTPFLRLR